MSAPLVTSVPDRAVDPVTANRAETKYLLAPDEARTFLQTARAYLPTHRPFAAGADTPQYVTSVYYDTPSHALLRAARADLEHNVKLRVRAYQDVALDPEVVARGARVQYAWLELKRREEGRARKVRIHMHKDEIDAFLRDARAAGRDEDAGEIVTFLRSLSEPVVPTCMVDYLRIALQCPAGGLRVTLDAEVRYHRAPHDPWHDLRALREAAGPAVAEERAWLLEVKHVDARPAWLIDALSSLSSAETRYSKFVRAGEAVLGAG